MSMDTEVFNRGGALDDKTEQARRAVKAFRAMQPTLSAYARILTKNPAVRVELAARDNGSTNGVKIFFRPPIQLGDGTPHRRTLCDKRDENRQLLCAACAVREKVLVTIYHEIAHICHDSFRRPVKSDFVKMLKLAVDEHGSKYGELIAERIDKAPYNQKHSFIAMAGLISPFLPLIVNALEDARVNRENFKARKGTKIMFEAVEWKIFTEGVEQLDAVTGNVVKVEWRNYPLNAQAIIGVFCKASGYDYKAFFAPSVVEALNDDELTKIVRLLDTTRTAAGVYHLSFPVLVRLRELGFCKSETDPQPEPEPEPEPEEEPEEQSDGEPDPDAEPEPESEPEGKENGDQDGDASETDDDEERQDGESDSSPNEGGAGEPGPRDDDEKDASPSDDESPDESGVSDEDVDSGDSDEGSEQDEQPDSDGSSGEGGDSDDGGQGEPEAGSANSGLGEPSDQEGSDDGDDQSNSDDRDEADSDRDGDDGGTQDSGSEESEGASDTDSPRDSEPSSDHDNDADSDSDDDEQGSVRQGNPSGDLSPDDGSGSNGGEGGVDDEGDLSQEEEGTPDDKDGIPSGDIETESGDGAGGRDSDPSSNEGSEDGEPHADSEDDGSEPELIDTGADDGTGGVHVDDTEMGTEEEALTALNKWIGHVEKPQEVQIAEKADNKLIDEAIIQGLYFETPSKNVNGVKEHFFDDDDTSGRAWTRAKSGRRDRFDIALGVAGDFEPSESILGPALLRMRVAFGENARGKELRHLKSGKVDGRVLGRRAFHNDERLFKARKLPGKRDYFVLIGVDISGSTVGENLAIEKRAVMAQAELLHRMGIKFAIYAHSGSYGYETDKGGYGIDLDIYHVKDPDEIWTDSVRERFTGISSDSCNLDGHTLEYYRKVLDREKATDKIILYYTDGKMPAENHDEELEILRREIKTCRRKGYTLLGVGIRTDSPIRHGLDTVQVDTEEDVVKVVRHIEKRLVVSR